MANMTKAQWSHLTGLAFGLRGITAILLPMTLEFSPEPGPSARKESERMSDIATAAKLLADDLYRLVDTLNEESVYEMDREGVEVEHV